MQKQIMSLPVWNICSYKDGFICSNNHQAYSTNNESLVYLFDKDFNLKSEMGKALANNTLPPFISYPFLKDENSVCYFDILNSTIYLISSTNTDNPESINFVIRNPIPLDILSDPQKFFENQMTYGFFNNAFLSDNILWSSFVDQGDLRVLIMDLKNKNQIIAKYNSWYPVIQCSSNGYFYAAINVDKVLEEKTITNTKRITQYPISYDSNPIILRFKPKQIFK